MTRSPTETVQLYAARRFNTPPFVNNSVFGAKHIILDDTGLEQYSQDSIVHDNDYASTTYSKPMRSFTPFVDNGRQPDVQHVTHVRMSSPGSQSVSGSNSYSPAVYDPDSEGQTLNL